MQLKSLLASVAALALVGAAHAQTKWDMPTPYADGEFHTVNVRQFVQEVKKASGGQIDINVHSNASLIKHPDMLRAVSTGQVPIAEFLLGQFGNEEAVFNADNVPFLAAGYDNAWKLYQAQKAILQKKMEGRGLVLLYSVPWPGQGLYTKNPVKSLDDFKGTKFRTYSPFTARLAELMGASPTVIQVPEVPQAFATGTITVMITSSSTGTTTKAWEFVKNYYTTNAMHPKNAVVVNNRAFQGLTGAQKKILTDSAAAAEKRGWELSRQRETTANKTLADNGMTVHTPDAGLMLALGKIGDTIAAEWLKAAGADGEAIIKAYRGK
ncbi:MAG: C4-dicarboxylate ABC transporter substrate-binding protein [Betaproteobacteria bacterium]|nr:C4-dicarboxylate ABC transporter substrate-binding protein [Betaproteobacteria bacterium]